MEVATPVRFLGVGGCYVPELATYLLDLEPVRYLKHLPCKARGLYVGDALQLEGPLGPLPVSVAELYATRAFV